MTRIQPGVRLDESGFLNAFDANRDRICAAAAKVFVRSYMAASFNVLAPVTPSAALLTMRDAIRASVAGVVGLPDELCIRAEAASRARIHG